MKSYELTNKLFLARLIHAKFNLTTGTPGFIPDILKVLTLKTL